MLDRARVRIGSAGPLSPHDRLIVGRTINAYDSSVTRFYCRGRFRIMRQRFLQEIGQYLPDRGRVLDVGCGFGLFSLYYSQVYPKLELSGIDLNPRRILEANRAADRLGVKNASYAVGDARAFESDRTYDGAYMMDIVHHIPPPAVKPLLLELYASLKPGACLIVKDVDSRPAYKRWFTFALDKLIDPHTPVHYWDAEELTCLLEEIGFRVYRHAMLDYLPYPHMLYACWKPEKAALAA
jgi:2-polyprenyl-3-methyl-5-hydroxy-6-metoxy-1,4-benzoquinol methylase